MQIIVVYIHPDVEFIETVEIQAGATVREVISASGLLAKYSEVSLDKNAVGVYGEIVTLATALKDKDRVEVYHPLTMDPMEARRKRVEQKTSDS